MSDALPTLVDVLPHAHPFRLLDAVLQAEPGAWAVAVHLVGSGDENLDANGTLPPVLLLEHMAQTAGLAAVGEDERGAVVATVDRFRARPARAGDRLVAFARVIRRFGASVKVRAAVRREGRWVAAADLVLRFL